MNFMEMSDKDAMLTEDERIFVAQVYEVSQDIGNYVLELISLGKSVSDIRIHFNEIMG